MSSNFPQAPTYAPPLEKDNTTGQATFSPLWIQWFLDIALYFTQNGPAGGSGPGGASGTLQYNNSGAFGGYTIGSGLGVSGGSLVVSGAALLAAANVFTQVQAVTPYRANISGAVSIDLTGTAKSNNLHLTLTGNVTSFALTNPVDGAVYNIRFIQDATGSRTVAGLSSAFKFSGGTAPTFSTAANAVDFLSAEYGASESNYVCAFLKGMA